MILVIPQAVAASASVDTALQIFAARAAAELQRQADDMRIRQQASLLNKASDAIIVRDLEHRITFWNEGAERLYGWSRAEALGHNAASLLYQDAQCFHPPAPRCCATANGRVSWQQYARDGRAIEVEGRHPVRSEQGEAEAILAINPTSASARPANGRSSAWRCSMPLPACPTARISCSAWARPRPRPSASARVGRCCSSI